MSRAARFEVVHTGPCAFHARFRAANGQVVFVTESYKRRRTAERAIEIFLHQCERISTEGYGLPIEVREVDER